MADDERGAMGSAGRRALVALVISLFGCADSVPPPEDGACAMAGDCPAGAICLDGMCQALPDVGPMRPVDRGPPDAEADMAPAPRAIGDPCDDGADCITGPCIEAAGDGRRVCTGPCDPNDPTGCPDGFVCAAVSNAGPDRTFLCFPEADFLCRDCADDSDCGGLSDRCLEQLDGSFCGRTCDLRACPEGYDCVADGDEPPQCVPAAGVCSGCYDPDGDGYGVGADCLGVDCAPDDGAISPAAAELCNGVDDDCDDAIDEDFDVMTDPMRCGGCDTACRFEGAAALCLDGLCALGECLPERYDLDRRVDNGCEYFCEGDPAAIEQCNGVDDDCDGAVDEGRPGADELCATGDAGRCGAGSTACEAGAIVCRRRFEPLPETCDGSDEDCDGDIDEGDPGAGVACETGEAGRCAAGLRFCDAGALVCRARPGARGEICDGIDDDCDETVDDGCPTAVITGVDRNLRAFGGGGGGPFELRCGAGQVAVGVDVRAGAEFDQVQVICQRVGLAVDQGADPYTYSTRAEGGQSRTGIAGGGGGGQSTLVCPGGSFLHALQVRSGARVDQAAFTCARLDFVGYPEAPGITRADTGSQTFGGQGGGAQAQQRCRDDELMSGLFGRSGGRIDQLGPICRTVGVQVR